MSFSLQVNSFKINIVLLHEKKEQRHSNQKPFYILRNELGTIQVSQSSNLECYSQKKNIEPQNFFFAFHFAEYKEKVICITKKTSALCYYIHFPYYCTYDN